MGSITEVDDVSAELKHGQLLREPLKASGILSEKYRNFPLTPSIGQEFPETSIEELLTAPNSSDLLRDLAITVSERGVVFFRNQRNLTIAQQKEFAQRLGELSGKPKSSKLHIHPLFNSERPDGHPDNEVLIISSEESKRSTAQYGLGVHWHTDTSFEPVPGDYATLQMQVLPPVGGDTLFASTYDSYDLLGPKYAQFLESLIGTFAAPGYQKAADAGGFTLYKGERGSPGNANKVLEAHHPLVRTNPVTGWKAIYAHTATNIEGLTEQETKDLQKYLMDLVISHHDTTVRFRWEPYDLAVWDSRSTLHAATPDFDYHSFPRWGNRVISVGEVPYLDPRSTSRRQALNKEGKLVIDNPKS